MLTDRAYESQGKTFAKLYSMPQLCAEYGVSTAQTLVLDLVELQAAKTRLAKGVQVCTVAKTDVFALNGWQMQRTENDFAEQIAARWSDWCAYLLLDVDFIGAQLLSWGKLQGRRYRPV